MKKFKRILLTIFTFSLASLAALCLIYKIAADNYEFDEKKLAKNGCKIVFLSEDFCTEYSSNGRLNAKLEELPEHVKNAFIAVEDKRFYSHGGIDCRALLRATKNNLLTLSLKEGGSTITQQLIKNTHLSGEKTLFRKMREYKLTKAAERELSKNQILEYYLNGIYFGENVYGVENAALRYFGKQAKNLTAAQSASLAATVKSPNYYNPAKEANSARRDLVLNLMREQNLLTEKEYSAAIKETYSVLPQSKENSFFKNACAELFSSCDVSPYSSAEIKVYTAYDEKLDKMLNDLFAGQNLASATVTNLRGEILAEKGNTGEKRSPASLVKPVLVYAPAIEEKTVTLATKILDEKTDFSGYSPANANDEYNGWVSAEYALVHSLNVPACKILQSTGLNTAVKYAEKAGVKVSDKSLACALGALGNGVDLNELCSAYATFARGGAFTTAHYVKKATAGGKVIFSRTEDQKRIFSTATCEIINYALKECAKSGTAKALFGKSYPVCAKTGTNGNKNGNFDALCAAYTPNYVSLVRVSGNDEQTYCGTSGGKVAALNGKILDFLESRKSEINEFPHSDDTVYAKLCKPSYNEQKLLLADPAAPERYCVSFPFIKGTQPQEFSTEFSSPTASGSVNVNGDEATIKICKKDFVNCLIFRQSADGKVKIADLKKEKSFCEENLSVGKHAYFALPYYLSPDGETIYGKEFLIGEIYVQNTAIPKDWWR